MALIRTGTCERCGECCTGEQGFPVPRNWPDAVRNWKRLDVEEHLPHLSLLGLGEDENGKLMKIADYGNFNLPGHSVYWRWVMGHGLCTNLEPLDDENTYEAICPFLEDESGGRRECSLVGTIYEEYYWRTCGDMAPERLDDQYDINNNIQYTAQQQADRWFGNNPSCTYNYIEE